MMTRGRGHVFDDMQKLSEMLRLRQQNVGPSELGRMYGVDHTTIIYHAKRYGVVVPQNTGNKTRVHVVQTDIEITVVPVVRHPRVTISNNIPRVQVDFDGDVLNPGKTYAEYMAEAAKREQIRKFGRPLLPESQSNHEQGAKEVSQDIEGANTPQPSGEAAI